ncbi:MAG: hypothetical protein WAZ19_08585, partial [Anaerolineae bacterium]
AGQTVQFRFRIGSDSSVSDTGWDVDDVMVQSCVAPTAVTLGAVEATSAPLTTLPWSLLLLAAGAAMAGAAGLHRRRA